jgi:hypothetical protein
VSEAKALLRQLLSRLDSPAPSRLRLSTGPVAAPAGAVDPSDGRTVLQQCPHPWELAEAEDAQLLQPPGEATLLAARVVRAHRSRVRVGFGALVVLLVVVVLDLALGAPASPSPEAPAPVVVGHPAPPPVFPLVPPAQPRPPMRRPVARPRAPESVFSERN